MLVGGEGTCCVHGPWSSLCNSDGPSVLTKEPQAICIGAWGTRSLSCFIFQDGYSFVVETGGKLRAGQRESTAHGCSVHCRVYSAVTQTHCSYSSARLACSLLPRSVLQLPFPVWCAPGLVACSTAPSAGARWAGDVRLPGAASQTVRTALHPAAMPARMAAEMRSVYCPCPLPGFSGFSPPRNGPSPVTAPVSSAVGSPWAQFICLASFLALSPRHPIPKSESGLGASSVAEKGDCYTEALCFLLPSSCAWAWI